MRRTLLLLILLLLSGLSLSLAACGGTDSPAAEEAPAVEEAPLPPPVVTVRDAAASYLREAAAICAPPEGASWQVDTAAAGATPGATVYRFVTGDCVLTVAGPDPLPEAPRFYVAYRNESSSFCWQALIDEQGSVLSTGYEQSVPGLDNPAQTYCQEQGHRFEVITRDDGTLCGACVLEDGTTCNAWSYLYGECGPP